MSQESGGEKPIEMAPKNELDRAGVRLAALELCEALLEHGHTERGSFAATQDELVNRLAALSHSEKAWAEGRYTPALRQAVRIFFDTYIQFAQDLKKTNSDSKKINDFVQSSYEALFSHTPNLTNFLSITDQLVYASKVTRVPELQGFGGASMVGEMAYEFSFAQPDLAEYLYEGIVSKSVADQLDALHTLETVGISAAGDGEWAEPGLRMVQTIVDQMREPSPSGIPPYPLVECAANIVLAKLEGEAEGPSQGMLRYHRDSRNGRARRFEKSDALAHDVLQKTYDFSRPPSGYLSAVSRDYIGVKDQSGRLLQLGRIPEAEGRGKPIVTLLSIEDAFTDPTTLPFGTAASNAEDVLLFQALHQTDLRAYIEDNLHIRYAEMSLRSQIQLLRFVSNKQGDRFVEFSELMAKPELDRQAFLETFFACSEDESLAEPLLYFVNEFPPEDVSRVLRSHQELLVGVQAVEQVVQHHFAGYTKQVDTRLVVQEIMRKANGLLRAVTAQSMTIEQFIVEAERFKQETLVFAATFKTLFKGKEGKQRVDFSNIQHLLLEESSASELRASAKDANGMCAIARANWSPQGAVGEQVVRDFESALNDPNDTSRFVVLRKDTKIAAFVRFKPVPDKPGHVFAGSFNVDPALRGFGIGEAMIETVLRREAERAILDATVKPSLEVGTRYVEDTGFFITGVMENFRDTGEPFFLISCDVSLAPRSQARSFSTTECLRRCDPLTIEDRIDNHEPIIVFTAPSADTQYVVPLVTRLTAQGYQGVRYFSHPDATKKERVYVFEKLPA